MTTILRLSNVFTSQFKGIDNPVVATLLKLMTFACMALVAVIVYAMVYRVATGFNF